MIKLLFYFTKLNYKFQKKINNLSILRLKEITNDLN